MIDHSGTPAHMEVQSDTAPGNTTRCSLLKR